MLAIDRDLCERDTLIDMLAKQTKMFRLRTVIFSLPHLGLPLFLMPLAAGA
jgi:hypothetical protein